MIVQCSSQYTPLTERSEAGQVARLMDRHRRIGWNGKLKRPVSVCHPSLRCRGLLWARAQNIERTFVEYAKARSGQDVVVTVRALPKLVWEPAIDSEGGEP